MSRFQLRSMFGSLERVITDEAFAVICNLCEVSKLTAPFRKRGHPFTEMVCEGCWEKAETWCFSCWKTDCRRESHAT